MAQVAGKPTEFSLGALNATTGWLPLFGLADDPCFNITGTFVGTLAVQVSNQDDLVKTRLSQMATYSAPVGPLAIPRIAARWFRLIVTAYTSGTAYVGTSTALPPQVDRPIPVDYFINPAGDQA